MTERLLPGIGPEELRALNRMFPERYPFLLQSTATGSEIGRYDILFAFPGQSIELTSPGTLRGRRAPEAGQFLHALDEWWASERQAPSASELPFCGGWFLYLGYELAAEVEPTLVLHSDNDLPIAFAVRCPAALVFDHSSAGTHLVVEDDDADLVQSVTADLKQLGGHQRLSRPQVQSVAEDDAQLFTTAVVDAKQSIEAGDIYQANLSRQWLVSVSDKTSAAEIYASLCVANPGPFAGIAHWQASTIISSSPERLAAVRGGRISTRPIAGTRRRGSNEVSDGSLSEELFAHPKERAEHVMLIDLERNDIGRVCVPGSVTVDEMMVLESYAHVHHIVSNVSGELRDCVTPGEAIAAVFPGGTITGCPKVRCMQIINEQEGQARGAYTGSFGYLNTDGSFDLNILIRTMLKRGNKVSFRAGAGIVADSDPVAELDETRAKAEGMLRAFDND